MSLYREPGQARRRRRATGAGVVAAVIIVAVVAVALLSGDDTPSGAERAKASRAAVAKALDGLELLEIEYAQAVDGGRVVAPTEYQAAQADVKRALDALADVDDQPRPGAYAEARGALTAVEAAVSRRVAAARLKVLIGRARAAVQSLAG